MGKISKNQQERCIEREKLDSGWLAGWLAAKVSEREREREGRGGGKWQSHGRSVLHNSILATLVTGQSVQLAVKYGDMQLCC
jgi:hypothetical protein